MDQPDTSERPVFLLENPSPNGGPRPNTLVVLAILVLTALTFSYLGSYAIYSALIAAQIVQPFQGIDPRPRWLLTGFCTLMLIFMGIGAIFRRMSRKAFQDIDEMADAQDPDRGRETL